MIIRPPIFKTPDVCPAIRQNNLSPALIYQKQQQQVNVLSIKSKRKVISHMNEIGSSNTNPRYRVIQPALDFSSDGRAIKV